jgi:hypothetical protein
MAQTWSRRIARTLVAGKGDAEPVAPSRAPEHATFLVTMTGIGAGCLWLTQHPSSRSRAVKRR